MPTLVTLSAYMGIYKCVVVVVVRCLELLLFHQTSHTHCTGDPTTTHDETHIHKGSGMTNIMWEINAQRRTLIKLSNTPPRIARSSYMAVIKVSYLSIVVDIQSSRRVHGIVVTTSSIRLFRWKILMRGVQWLFVSLTIIAKVQSIIHLLLAIFKQTPHTLVMGESEAFLSSVDMSREQSSSCSEHDSDLDSYPSRLTTTIDVIATAWINVKSTEYWTGAAVYVRKTSRRTRAGKYYDLVFCISHFFCNRMPA